MQFWQQLNAGQQTRRRGGAAWTPAGPTTDGGASPGAWWDASAIEGLSDTDPVASWPDLANSYDFAQETPADRPLYRTNIANSLPVVRFTAGDKLLATGGVVTGDNARTVIMVCNPDSDGSYYTMFALANGGSEIGQPYVITPELAVRAYHRTWVGVRGFAALGLVTSNYAGGGLATNHVMRLDGSPITQDSGATGTISTSSAGMQIGGTTPATPDNYAGDIAEVLVYASSLSELDVAQLESYLATKWGIAL